MHLAVGVMLLCGAGVARPRPAPAPLVQPWSPFVQYGEPQIQNYEFVGPALIGEMINPRVTRNPLPSVGDYVVNSVQAGINFFDNLVPPVYESAVRPVDLNVVDTIKNFTRPRRHENLITSTPAAGNEDFVPTTTIIAPTIESIAIVTPIAPPIMTSVIEDKMDVNPPVATPRADTAELELIIKKLNNALTHIQNHGNEQVHEEINNSTLTEKLVQYISSQVELISKNKNSEGREQKIKQVSKALNILLNRIAKSAKPLLPPKASSDEKGQLDPLLMARIVQHVAELKKNAITDKVNNGYELSSAELDGGLPTRFRPVRQDSADNGDDNSGENDVSTDVEQISSTTTTVKPDEVTARQEGSSEQQSSSQEGGGNLVANLLSSFLGSLSQPNGAVDVDAIVALVSGLSVQRDDGTFDFSGVTDLLQSFLGGDGDGEGGSDVGAFLGGLLGAVLQGSANPPGAKGTGRLTGNLIAGILPGLSGPPPPSSSEEAGGNAQPGKRIDSGSFLAGLLTSMLGASSGSSSGSSQPMNGADNHKMGSASFFTKLKQQLFKTIFGLITSILGASSSGISQASGASGQKFGGRH